MVAQRQSSYTRAGICLPVARVKAGFAPHTRYQKIRLPALVFAAAGLDFLVKDLIDIALNNAERKFREGQDVPTKIRVTPRDLRLAAEEDICFRDLISREVEINGGGLFPTETRINKLRAIKRSEQLRATKAEKAKKKAAAAARAAAAPTGEVTLSGVAVPKGKKKVVLVGAEEATPVPKKGKGKRAAASAPAEAEAEAEEPVLAKKKKAPKKVAIVEPEPEPEAEIEPQTQEEMEVEETAIAEQEELEEEPAEAEEEPVDEQDQEEAE